MHLSYYTLILPVLVFVLVLLITFRKLYSTPQKTTKSTSMKASNKTTRIAEGIILLCAGMAMFVFTATNRSTNGLLLIFDQLNSGFAIVNIIIAIIVIAGLIAGVIVTLRLRTSVGFWIAAIFVSGYGILLNNHSDFLRSLALGDSAVPKIPYLLRLSNSPIVGAELWVNGVLLGKTPVRTTLKEFLEKVPYWPEPPEGYRDGTDEVHALHYNPRGGRGYSIYQRWKRFELPDIPERYGSLRKATQDKYYYARVKYDDRWGYFTSGGGGGGSGGGYTYSAESHFPAVFPNLEERLDKMLDIARISDYQADADWFEAMETFGQTGLNAIYKAIENEPDMSQVLDNWAIWKYELNKVTDEKSAWKVFENICDEADRIQSYSTSSIAGRAVEMIISKIDLEQIVGKAISIIRSIRYYGWAMWRLNDKVQFGMTYRPEGILTPSGDIIGGGTSKRNNGPKVSYYAVAHAVWKLDELLDSQDDTQPNIVELKVVPNLLCWHNTRTESIRIAASLGGPDIEKYLYRHNWKTTEVDFSDHLRMTFHGEFTNGALFLLANLKSPFGQKFRRENKRQLMEMADQIHIMGMEDYGFVGQNPFGFLFIDKNIAMEYWPKFKIRTLQDYDAPTLQFNYLVNMEPNSTVDMYVQAWRGYSKDSSFLVEALPLLGYLPQEKHEQVIEQIEKCIKNDVSQIQSHFENPNQLREYLLREVKDGYWSRDRKARDIIAGLRTNSGEYKSQAVSDWLEHTEPDHPLIGMLAEAAEPELRLLIMGALREHPIPANRAIMTKLLQDREKEVRMAAEEVAAELEELKETPPMQFAVGNIPEQP